MNKGTTKILNKVAAAASVSAIVAMEVVEVNAVVVVVVVDPKQQQKLHKSWMHNEDLTRS